MNLGLIISFGILASGQAGPKTNHWSFRSPIRPSIPRVKNIAWVRNPIDAFVLNRLEGKGLPPSSAADRRMLLRRVTFDLTGLPPSPQETDSFIQDKSPNAYEKVVTRLLASPRFGERWGQHWLDVVRYGETNGYEHDGERPQVWRYRDYVIRAFNSDKPYNQFLMDQIAGDLVAPEDFTKHVATGFLRAGPQHITGGNQDLPVNRQEWLTEATNGIGNAVLGLTVGCARCHDHKYDPILQADYYRLQAFFAPSDNSEYKRVTPEQQKAFDAALKVNKDKQKAIEDQIAVIEKPYREKLKNEKITKLPQDIREALATDSGKRTQHQKDLVNDIGPTLNISWDEALAAVKGADLEKRTALRKQLHKLEAEEPEPLPTAMCVSDIIGPVQEMHINQRGDPHVPGKVVEAGFPGAIRFTESSSIVNRQSSPTSRLALAQWLTRHDHPLTARVMVNRLWEYCFGKGIVATPNDFGLNGQRPTNQELLDWLATEFINRGWSVKSILYLICTSDTYRQSSAFDPGKARVDPDNRLIWRMSRKRLDGEAIRDSVLACSGQINLQMGGPWIKVPLEPEVIDTIFTEYEPDNLWPVDPDPRQHCRRTIYLHRKRNVRIPMLAAFDQPDMMTSCAARDQSVHALQSLILVNSDFMRAQSKALAKRILKNEPYDETRYIDRLFRITFGRSATSKEIASTHRFLIDEFNVLCGVRSSIKHEKLPASVTPDVLAAWSDLCLAMYNLNEFIYVQ